MIRMNDTASFMGFDVYMTCYILQIPLKHWFSAEQKIREEWKETAYHTLIRQLGRQKYISRPTVKRWFGLNGSRAVYPKREHVLKMGLMLGWSQQQLQECLLQGLCEPGIIINDYSEMLYLYCAANHLSLEKCEDMIHAFELEARATIEMEQKSHTDLLWKMYQINKEKTPACFLAWMVEHAALFKGYSLQGLRTFLKYREMIVSYVQMDMQEQLEEALRETNFYEWSRQQGYTQPDYDRGVLQYLKNKKRQKQPGISQEELETIQRLHQQAYSKMDKSTTMLRELYAPILHSEKEKGRSIAFHKGKDSFSSNFHFMTDDYVSKLLTVAQQKERLFYFSAMQTQTKGKEWEQLCKNQKQRCRIVQREDILPMVQYVAARQYMDLEQLGEETDICARQMFEKMAQEALKQCDMAPLNRSYRLDNLLLSCYDTPEISYMAEVLEIIML